MNELLADVLFNKAVKKKVINYLSVELSIKTTDLTLDFAYFVSEHTVLSLHRGRKGC